jgi:hypothetical protein
MRAIAARPFILLGGQRLQGIQPFNSVYGVYMTCNAISMISMPAEGLVHPAILGSILLKILMLLSALST